MYMHFAEEMLKALYQESDQQPGKEIRFSDLATKYGIELKQHWITQIADEWADVGYANVNKHIGNPSGWRVSIAAGGMRYIEEEYAAHDGIGQLIEAVGETEKALSRLIPASDRIVTQTDNQPKRVETLAAVAQAITSIESSNVMLPNEKAETLTYLNAGQSILEKCNNFAIGAIRYLILDRLKLAFEGAIEDAFKITLVSIFLTIAAYLLTLL